MLHKDGNKMDSAGYNFRSETKTWTLHGWYLTVNS